MDLMAAVVTAVLGLLVLSLPPRSLARIAFGVGMLLLAVESALALVSAEASGISIIEFCQEGALVVAAVVAPVWLLFSLHYSRGEELRLPRGWRAVVVVAFVAPLCALLIPGALLHGGGPAMFELGDKARYLHCSVLLTTVVTLTNLEQTFRAVTGTMRWRIKFLLLGLGIILLQQLFASGAAIIQEEWFFANDVVRSIVLIAGSSLIIWSLARMGLSEVSVYPSKKVMVTAATTSLILSYCLVVGAVAWAVAKPMGEGTLVLPSLIVLVGWLLMATLLFSDRIRQRSIRFVNRHFSRPQYDYRTLWQTFTERVAPAGDESEYSQLSADFVSQTLSALSVTIWHVGTGQRKLGFGGSTSLTTETARQLLSANAVSDDFLEALLKLDGVLDLDDSQASWQDVRSRLFSSQFQEGGGHRLFVPLRAGGELVGLLLVGDRVGAEPYTAEEVDLLHTIAGEIGRGLLNLRHSSQLAASRELQAFQTMSAFVIHDLKNTASTLSLTLQNFQQHHDNPSFRDDALRSVAWCVSHINDVVIALGGLRQGLQTKPTEVDLNALVREALADLGGDQFLPVHCSLQQTPPLLLDRVQIKKVLTNLLLNARDAVGTGGRVELSTGLRSPRQVELMVRDNGCGMDQDYVQNRLFRPFSTTKKSGLGIGLFQARMIMEAHHGDIEVESVSGRGTVFRVLLPLKADGR